MDSLYCARLNCLSERLQTYAMVCGKRVAFTKQLQTHAKKWNVFFFAPEKEMVFLAENFKMNQACIFKNPNLLIKNWSMLCEV